MNKLLTTIILFSLSSGIYAQEKEIWACQVTNSTGFKFEENEGITSTFKKASYLLTIDGADSLIKEGEDVKLLDCEDSSYGWTSCISHESARYISMSKENGLGSYASTGGATIRGIFTANLELIQCTKF
jgi:hypothetical protein